MHPEIIDVHSLARSGVALSDLPAQVVQGLVQSRGHKRLPTMLLYDDLGLELYDDITTEASEYYLFGAEEEILRTNADNIVRAMHHTGTDCLGDEVVLELGAGTLRKTSHILLGLSRLVDNAGSPPIAYFALDLEQRQLARTLEDIAMSDVGKQLRGKVTTKGLCGTYDDGLKFVENGGLQGHRISDVFTPVTNDFVNCHDFPPSTSVSSLSEMDRASSPPSTPGDFEAPLHVIFLGSSLGNFTRDESAKFLRSLPLRPGSGDTLLIGLDHDNDRNRIEAAYNDCKGYTRRFIMNGLKSAGRALGDAGLFDEANWEYVNHYDTKKRRHEAFYVSRLAQTVHVPLIKADFHFLEGESVKIEQSYKYSDGDAFSLFTESNLRPLQRWTDSASLYSLWLLERPPFSFPLLCSPFSYNSRGEFFPRLLQSNSPFGVPARQDWENLWAAWDCITDNMISPPLLYQKPINLRHICLFYLGHIPTFLDIHLSKLLEEPNTEPEEFKRGIDPDVDEPSMCRHPHSEVPIHDVDWPDLAAVLRFKSRVRARLLRLYDDLAVEAECNVMTRKIGRVLFMTLEHEAMHAETLLYMLLQRVGSGTLPPPGFSTPSWDVLSESWKSAELPASKTVNLGPALVSLGHDDDESQDVRAGVDDHEYGWDNENPRRTVRVNKFEISWRPVTNREFFDFYCRVDKDRVTLPASWVEDAGIVKVLTLYGPVSMDVAEDWPVITSYNNLSTYATMKGGRLPTEAELRVFFDKFDCGYEGGANVGFRNWHPVPATTGGRRRESTGHNGGVWEWTSTVFAKEGGFVASELYPGYSTDFFDDKHQVVIGGSFATVPRIAGRRSFRNWYQRNYPYAWIGGRVAFDIVD